MTDNLQNYQEDGVSIDLYEEKLVELASAIAAARWLLTCLRGAACRKDGWSRDEIAKLAADAEKRWPGVFDVPCPNTACQDGFVPSPPDAVGWFSRCPDCAARSAGQAAFLPKGDGNVDDHFEKS